MDHIIEGCLVKYNVPWFNGTIILPGALGDGSDSLVPVLEDLACKDKVLGHANLYFKEDGVYYKCCIDYQHNEDELIDWILDNDLKIGMFANQIKRNDKTVAKGTIRCIGFSKVCDEGVAEITSVDGKEFKRRTK